MNERRDKSHEVAGSKKAQPPEPDYTVVDIPEVEEIKPVLIETIPYGASKKPAMVASNKLFVKRYNFGFVHLHKVPPNKAIVISGPFGTRVATGRSTLVNLTEIANEVNLELIAIPIFERDIRTKSIYPVDIEALVHFKVKEDEESIKRAAQLLLSRSNEEVANMIQEIVNGHLREICATMSIGELQDQMEQFNSRVVAAAQPDFEKLGFTIKVFVLKHIVDRENYFRAKTAETRRELSIREAEAKKEEDIRTANLLLEGKKRKAEVWAEVFRCQQEVLRELTTRDMVAPVVEEGLRIELADREKRVKQLQAEAEAIRIEEIARAEASKNRMKGEAEAAVKTAMTRIFQGLDQGSLGLYLADRLPAILTEVAAGVKNFDVKWAHVGGQPTASDPINKTIQNLLFSMIPIFQLFGFDLKDLTSRGKKSENIEKVIQKLWSNLSPENQKTILEKVISNLDKDILKEILQK